MYYLIYDLQKMNKMSYTAFNNTEGPEISICFQHLKNNYFSNKLINHEILYESKQFYILKTEHNKYIIQFKENCQIFNSLKSLKKILMDFKIIEDISQISPSCNLFIENNDLYLNIYKNIKKDKFIKKNIDFFKMFNVYVFINNHDFPYRYSKNFQYIENLNISFLYELLNSYNTMALLCRFKYNNYCNLNVNIDNNIIIKSSINKNLYSIYNKSYTNDIDDFINFIENTNNENPCKLKELINILDNLTYNQLRITNKDLEFISIIELFNLFICLKELKN